MKRPDKDDWGKLKQIHRYLYDTRHMKLNLSADNLTTIRWWVDASHAVHDCQGHTGAMMSMGKGAAISFSNKHKLNTKSSSESKLVSAAKPSPLSYTHNTSLRHKATPLNKTSFSKTTSVPCD